MDHGARTGSGAQMSLVIASSNLANKNSCNQNEGLRKRGKERNAFNGLETAERLLF